MTFAEIERLLATGCYVGRGAIQNPERHSLAIDVAMALARLITYLNGLGGGLYWCRRDDFEAIGGFDERVATVDDFDFAAAPSDPRSAQRAQVREPSASTGNDIVPKRRCKAILLRPHPLTASNLSDL